MKIYTRGGDKGNTQIYVDKAIRVEKDDAILNCYGDLDELNCHIGLLLSIEGIADAEFLTQIQRNLFNAGFVISASSSLSQDATEQLEAKIDEMTAQLPPQTRFILPGGCASAAQAHVCRAVCRRAERSVVTLSHQHDVPSELISFINRLSDFFFTYARYCNFQNKVSDTEI